MSDLSPALGALESEIRNLSAQAAALPGGEALDLDPVLDAFKAVAAESKPEPEKESKEDSAKSASKTPAKKAPAKK